MDGSAGVAMKFKLNHGLPFVEMTFSHHGAKRTVANMLIDTGSAATLLSAEVALELGLEPEITDVIRTMRGIGGEDSDRRDGLRHEYERHSRNGLSSGHRRGARFEEEGNLRQRSSQRSRT